MSQRMRRTVSPSTNVTKQGPWKAVVAYSLKSNGSASSSKRCNSTSSTRDVIKINNERHVAARKSPDCRLLPERSPRSPNQRGDRPPVYSPGQYLPASAVQASSPDPLLPYLTGQWPKDVSSCHGGLSPGVFMCDKSTQTINNRDLQVTDRKKYKSHRRSSSFDHDLSKESIRHRLQKSKDGSPKQRRSPLAGVHSPLSLTAPPSLFAQSTPLLIPPSLASPPSVLAQSTAQLTTPSLLLPARHSINRGHCGSVEGLNVEIEKLVLSKSTWSSQGLEDGNFLKARDAADGRRAPIPEPSRLSCTRTVDTQTQGHSLGSPGHSLGSDGHSVRSQSHSACQSLGSRSASPTTPRSGINQVPDLSPDTRSTSGDSKGDCDSPDPYHSRPSPQSVQSCPFIRQPPDGCEKVTVIGETRRPSIKEALFCPVKPQFVFRQSQDSAFSLLRKAVPGGQS